MCFLVIHETDGTVPGSDQSSIKSLSSTVKPLHINLGLTSSRTSSWVLMGAGWLKPSSSSSMLQCSNKAAAGDKDDDEEEEEDEEEDEELSLQRGEKKGESESVNYL